MNVGDIPTQCERLLARGFALFPVRLRGKEPLTEHGFKNASRELPRIAAWASRYPDCNWGVALGAPSECFVLDFDTKDGPANFGREHTLPRTYTVETFYGYHLFYKLPSDGVRTRKLEWGELRSDGSYVVGEGSMHPAGVRYERICDADLAVLPSALLEYLRSAPAISARSGQAILRGHRNSTLTSMAGGRRRLGMTKEAIQCELREINEAYCSPPLPDREVDAIAASVSRYAPAPRAAIDKPPIVTPSSSVWAADTMEVFLDDSTSDETEPLYDKVLYRETVTEIFSPRGVGKSLFALFLAVSLALKGLQVLLLDRDNPRRVVRERLRAWGAGAELSTLKVITREKCPPLTNAAAWAQFPHCDYEVVILDSLDSMAEGVGEQDSSKPSRAIAAVLDIARREGGPGVLILGNCVRTGKHSRGSGVIEDRADIVFEVRDCTNFHPSGKKPWIEELPAADAASWASKSSRRKGQARLRLALIPTKFRIGEEPEPFAVEINTTTHPWTLADVTDSIDQEGKAERERQAQERVIAVNAATELLKAEIVQREARGDLVLLKKQAEAFLTDRGVKQKIARDAINSPTFETVDVGGKGHPKRVRLAGKTDSSDRNSIPAEGPVYAASSTADFGQPHKQSATEIDHQENPCLGACRTGTISVEDPLAALHQTFPNPQSELARAPRTEGQGTEEEL